MGTDWSKRAAIAVLTGMLVATLTLCCGGDETPQASFSGNPTSGSTPFEVEFADQSTGKISRWQWDFDNDGSTDSEEQNPLHTYQNPGKYTVSLTVTGPSGTVTEVKTDYITVLGDEVDLVDADGDGRITSQDALLLMKTANQYYETNIKAAIDKAGIERDESGNITDPKARQKLKDNLTAAEYERLLEAIQEYERLSAQVDAVLEAALQ